MSLYEAVERDTSLASCEYEEPPYQPFELSIIEQLKEFPCNYGAEAKRRYFPLLCNNFLAHGSYGACPNIISSCCHAWSLLIECNPVHFYYKLLYPYLIRSIRQLAQYVGANNRNIKLVTNVEYGIETVLSSISSRLVFIFDFNYGAITTALDRHSKKNGGSLLKIPVTYPITSETICKNMVDFFDSCGFLIGNTDGALCVFEHITSPTAILLPIQELIQICKARGISTLIDGAHGIGSVKLDLLSYGCDYYVSNLHKWMCSPRGCAFLYVCDAQLPNIHPLIATWGFGLGPSAEFIWQGTDDYSAFLCIPIIIQFLSHFHENFIIRNQELAAKAARKLQEKWNTETLVHTSMCASMFCIKIPDDLMNISDPFFGFKDAYDIEVPIFTFQMKRWARVSIHVYNDEFEVEALGSAVLEWCNKLRNPPATLV
jgi:isopenicillin-N epimerase